MIHLVYNNLSQCEIELVDSLWMTIARHVREAGYKAANDDRAERLVEALAVYLRDSNER